MDTVLQGIPGVIYYTDDILVTGKQRSPKETQGSIHKNRKAQIPTKERKMSVSRENSGIFGSSA